MLSLAPHSLHAAKYTLLQKCHKLRERPRLRRVQPRAARCQAYSSFPLSFPERSTLPRARSPSSGTARACRRFPGSTCLGAGPSPLLLGLSRHPVAPSRCAAGGLRGLSPLYRSNAIKGRGYVSPLVRGSPLHRIPSPQSFTDRQAYAHQEQGDVPQVVALPAHSHDYPVMLGMTCITGYITSGETAPTRLLCSPTRAPVRPPHVTGRRAPSWGRVQCSPPLRRHSRSTAGPNSCSTAQQWLLELPVNVRQRSPEPWITDHGSTGYFSGAVAELQIKHPLQSPAWLRPRNI
ncbi:hypothetical protein NDU88_006276 [Pleurodeles waltl]|uniref:Uncharacterized protein n=1 Tax=Pleurodeles waltl TaxID=8319 RepID=A0AAV7QJL2_PLEWA|nr:hypothetical protein NDU88_006276 [Pleurodeles waltl]